MDKKETEKYFSIIMTQKTNNTCFDCNKQSPTWVNLKYGVIVCTDCAVEHRKNGFRLKSILLDTFKKENIRRIALGGNFVCQSNDFIEKYNNLSYRIKELDEKMEKNESLEEILEEKDFIKNKSVINEIKKPLLGKKVDKLEKITKKEENSVIKESVIQKNKVVIKEEVSLNKRNNLETGSVDTNRIGLGIFRIKKEEKK